MQKQTKIVSPEFIRLFIYSMAICMGMNMLNVVVPLYTTETLGQSTAVAGLMSTVYTIAACVSRPVNGALTDRLGRQKVMILGGVLFAFGCTLCGVIPALAVLAISRVFMGVGYSAGSTACNTASMDVIPPERMSEGIGYFGMSQSVSSALGSAIAAFAVASLGNQYSMLAVAATGVLGIVVALLVRYEKKPGYEKPAPAEGKKGGLMFEKSAILPSVYQGLSLFLITLLMCFMTLYIVHIGLPASAAGTFFTVSSIVIVAVRMGLSNLMNRLPVVAFLFPGYGALIAACLILPFVTTTAALMGISVLFGLAHGLIWMALGSEAVRLSPPEGRGAANATFYFAFDAAIGLGAAFWGGMIDGVGYNVCFRAVAVAAVVLAAASVPVFRRRMKQK